MEASAYAYTAITNSAQQKLPCSLANHTLHLSNHPPITHPSSSRTWSSRNNTTAKTQLGWVPRADFAHDRPRVVVSAGWGREGRDMRDMTLHHSTYPPVRKDARMTTFRRDVVTPGDKPETRCLIQGTLFAPVGKERRGDIHHRPS